MGWELFSHYVRALHEAKPRFFVYENNKSMSNAIRESITQTFGFEPICINSALVSAQNRQRLYWVGKRNDDGTYSRVKVEQPEDRGILLRDILDGVTDREKGRCVLSSIGRTTTREYFKKDQGTMTFEPVTSTVLNINPSGKGINGAVGRIDAKSRCLTTNKGEGQKIIVPVGVGYRGRMDNGKWVKRY
jgi:DNA (cytosine-5)-methyltransferase 3A